MILSSAWPTFKFKWYIVWVTLRVSYKRQELLTFQEHLGSPPIFCGSVLLIFLYNYFSVLFCTFLFALFVFVLSVQCLECFWIVPRGLSILDRFSLTFIYLVWNGDSILHIDYKGSEYLKSKIWLLASIGKMFQKKCIP